MENQDHLTDFLGNLADKIKTAKEHKSIMEAVYASASASEVVKEQEDPFINFLQKVGNTVVSKLPKKDILTEISTVATEPVLENTDKSTIQLGNKIREAIEQAKLQPKEILKEQEPQQIKTTEDEENKSAKNLAQKIKDAIERAKNQALEPPATIPSKSSSEEQENSITGYIQELEKIKDTGTIEQQEEATTSLKDLKKYIDKTVQDYARRILDLGGGGGSVAVQYAKGGTMDGTLNVNGHILSGGKNIANYFGTGGGDPAVNSVVYSNSANWNSTYTTVNTYSGAWSTGLQTLVFNENDANLSISSGNTVSLSALSSIPTNLGDIPQLSANWNQAYLNLVSNSAAYLSGVKTNYQYLSTTQSVILNNKYGIDTITTEVTATLPNNPNYGDQIEFFDIGGTWATNNFYVNANGKNIEQDISGILKCNVNYGKFELIYTNNNQVGWRIIPYPKHDIPTYTVPPIVIL